MRLKMSEKLKKIGIFNQAEATQLGVNRMSISRLVAKGEIEKLAPNVYRHINYPLDVEIEEFAIACKRMGEQSAIAGFSALQVYGLIEEIISDIWVLVPSVKSPRHGTSYQLLRTKKSTTVGITHHNDYRITTPERAIVDCFLFKKNLGIYTGIQAFRIAVQNKISTPQKIMKMAKILDVDKIILGNWEAINVT